MRDWFLPLVPVATVIYFVAYPQQFDAFVLWAETLMR